jgi:hypothetical protein
METEFQRLKSTYLTQADVYNLTYENFLNLRQSDVNQIASRISNFNDQGILMGLFLKNTGYNFNFVLCHFRTIIISCFVNLC